MKRILSVKKKLQRGFTLIELLIVIAIIGTLSTIAIPKFTDTIVLANTAKVQSDLSVLNSAIVLFQAENGTYPTNLTTDMKNYIVDIEKLQPPKGKVFLRDGSTVELSAESYALSADNSQATCDGHTLSEFGKRK